MKNLNVAIPDTVDVKLDKIMTEKEFKNRADAVAWLIETVFAELFKGEPT
jgi:metal-responsive CopG/Arc/MetJ family transcriptional regulator